MLNNIQNADISGKTILLRTDFNVPIDGDGCIEDYFRVNQTRKTIDYILSKNGKIIIVSHIGRPKNGPEDKYSLLPIYSYLKNIYPKLELMTFSKFNQAKNHSQIVLLENIRFHPEEEANDTEFAKILASFADIYVNDAFSCSHRKHASMHKIQDFLPSYAGFLLQNEVTSLEKYFKNSKPPMLAIIGGSKISTKINLLLSLLSKVDKLIIGGAMANNFLYALGYPIGNSLYEPNYIETTLKIIEESKKRNIELLLPIDFFAAKNHDSEEKTLFNPGEDLKNLTIFDIGPKSINLFKDAMSNCKTILWNGPLGYFEKELFETATKEIAAHLSELTTRNKIISIIGGGDSLSAINKFQLSKNFTYISTAGGAFLEWIEKSSLPCI